MQVCISAFLVSSFQLGDGNVSATHSDECRVQHVLFLFMRDVEVAMERVICQMVKVLENDHRDNNTHLGGRSV